MAHSKTTDQPNSALIRAKILLKSTSVVILHLHYNVADIDMYIDRIHGLICNIHLFYRLSMYYSEIQVIMTR